MPNCPLCESSEAKPSFSERGYQVLRCLNCELFYIDPYPQDADRHHQAVTDNSFEGLEVCDPATHHTAEILFFDRYFEAINRECEGATSVLDVGCGCGSLLERLARPNFRRVGIELNSARAAFARKATGCEIVEVPIEQFAGDDRFDVITLMNVLSHIPSLDDLFLKFKALLAPNGKLILKVGEMRNDVKKSAIFDWYIPDHLHFLGMKTIDYICEKYGFSIIRHDRIPYSEELFSQYSFKAKGRSAARDAVKGIIARTPLALPLIAQTYEMIHRKSVLSSFIVMQSV